jgi:hypothetical protein
MKKLLLGKFLIIQLLVSVVFNVSSMQLFSSLDYKNWNPSHYFYNTFFGDTKKIVVTCTGLCGLGLGFYALYNYYQKQSSPLQTQKQSLPLQTNDILLRIAKKLDLTISFEELHSYWYTIKEPTLLNGQRDTKTIRELDTYKMLFSDTYWLIEEWQKPSVRGVHEYLFLSHIQEEYDDFPEFKEIGKENFEKLTNEYRKEYWQDDEFKQTELFKECFELYYKTKIEKARKSVANHKKLNQEPRKQLAQAYKIHLMPLQKNFEHVLFLLFQALKNNQELRNKIADIKLLKEVTCTQKDLTFKALDGSQQIFAPIVIYPSDGKKNAQFVLDTLKNILKDQKGSNIKPRYNRKVNSLIWYAQGDGDYKVEMYKDYYEEDFVHYKPDFVEPGVMQDHTLQI